jgi:carboxymethylenebutenolidase
MPEMVSISTPDGSFNAYVARPSGTPKAAVVAIQEIFGVNKVMRDVADDLAKQGYLALAPDLFWRLQPGVDITDQTPEEWQQAFGYFQKFDVDAGVGDIQATINVARGMVDGGKVGAVGYCLGGLLAYLTACRTTVDASVSYYGVSINDRLADAAGIAKPLVLHIAAKDEYVPPPAQEAIIAGLTGKPGVSIHIYEGEDHAFARPGGAHYSEAAAMLANTRTGRFFEEHLG